MKNYLIVCSFIPIVVFTLVAQLKGDVDLLGLTLVVGLSALLLVIAVYPQEIARWWARRQALKKHEAYRRQAQLYASTITPTPWRKPVPRPLTPEQRRKAKEKLAQSRGIGVESITDQSVDLAIANNNVLLSGIFTDSGVNSYSSSLDTSSSCDTGSASDSSGGGCD